MQTQCNIFTSLRTAVNHIYMHMLARRITSTRPRSSLQLQRSCTLGALETNTPPSTTYQIFKTPHVHSSGTHARITCAWGSYIKGIFSNLCYLAAFLRHSCNKHNNLFRNRAGFLLAMAVCTEGNLARRRLNARRSVFSSKQNRHRVRY